MDHVEFDISSDDGVSLDVLKIVDWLFCTILGKAEAATQGDFWVVLFGHKVSNSG